MTRIRLIAAIAFALSVFVWTSPVVASQDGFPTDGPWRGGVSVLTDFPIQVGGELHLEMPERVRLHTSLGVLPGPYLDAIHAMADEFNWYGDDTAALISAALQDALIWRIKAGWRPFAEHGFFFSGGYTLAALGGGLRGTEVIGAAIGQPNPPQVGAGRDFDLAATVHMVDVELGWELLLVEGLLLRFALGGTFTADAVAHVEPTWDVSNLFVNDVDTFSREGEIYLEETIEAYVHTLTLSVALGYRF